MDSQYKPEEIIFAVTECEEVGICIPIVAKDFFQEKGFMDSCENRYLDAIYLACGENHEYGSLMENVLCPNLDQSVDEVISHFTSLGFEYSKEFEEFFNTTQ